MAAKKPASPAEQRAALQRQLDELDLSRLQAVQEIFGRPEVVKAVADLRELFDATDTAALHRSATADANALVGNALVPFDNIPQSAQIMAAQLEAKLNPAAEPETPAVLQLPGGPAAALLATGKQ